MSSEFYLQTKIKINEMDKSMVPFKIFSYSITNRYTLHETRYTYVHYMYTYVHVHFFTESKTDGRCPRPPRQKISRTLQTGSTDTPLEVLTCTESRKRAVLGAALDLFGKLHNAR